MIPKTHRLTAQEVRSVHTTGQVFRVPGFLVRYSNSTAETSARFAVIVSSKYAKTRVGRHAYTRAVYRALAPALHQARPGRYCIYVTAPYSSEVSTSQFPHVLARIQKGI